MPEHKHQFDCPETDEHAETPLYDEAAWDHGFAPMPGLMHLPTASPIAGI